VDEEEYLTGLWESLAEYWAAGTPITVSAQQYGQRNYTEDELLGVSDDLIAEARRARETA
jgi:hypothetical protein